MKTEIEQFCPCTDALEFRLSKPSFEDAWKDCPRGDWMLWIASKLKVDHRILTLAKARCANTVRHLMTDPRSTNAVDVVERYGQNLATRGELDAAAAAARDAAYDAAAAAYGAAAYGAAAAYAAYDAAAAARDAAYDAADAADAAYGAAAYGAAADAADAAYGAYGAYAAAAREKNRKKTADICRETLTEVVLYAINNLPG